MLDLLVWLILLAPILIPLPLEKSRESATLRISLACVSISWGIWYAIFSKSFPIEIGYWMGFLIAIGGLYYRELILSQTSKEGKLIRRKDYPALSERFQTELLIRFLQVSPMIAWTYSISSSTPIPIWIVGALILVGIAIYFTIHEHKSLWKDPPSPDTQHEHESSE